MKICTLIFRIKKNKNGEQECSKNNNNSNLDQNVLLNQRLNRLGAKQKTTNREKQTQGGLGHLNTPYQAVSYKNTYVAEWYMCIDCGELLFQMKGKYAYHDISHSATYSTPTIQPSTDQYINHLSRSSSDAGLCDNVLYDAYPG